jgi:hypothetical protein
MKEFTVDMLLAEAIVYNDYSEVTEEQQDRAWDWLIDNDIDESKLVITPYDEAHFGHCDITNTGCDVVEVIYN